MNKQLLSEPLQIIQDDLLNQRNQILHSVRFISELTEEQRNEAAKYNSGLKLLSGIKSMNTFYLIQKMHANALKKPKPCKHKRTKYRMKSWAQKYNDGRTHEQGFKSKVLTCRDCGIEL